MAFELAIWIYVCLCLINIIIILVIYNTNASMCLIRKKYCFDNDVDNKICYVCNFCYVSYIVGFCIRKSYKLSRSYFVIITIWRTSKILTNSCVVKQYIKLISWCNLNRLINISDASIIWTVEPPKTSKYLKYRYNYYTYTYAN